jgi:uncharacterized protein YdaU (DUF1376 family)
MAEHDHYMKFYPADYLADTGHLSTEEHGAYLLLIIAAFKRAGRLPVNQERLRRLAGGVDEARWPEIWASISEFFDIDGHELVQARAKAEWERARDAVEKAKIAGKASGDSRRRNKTPTGVEPELNGCSNGSSTGVGTSVQLGPQLGTNDPDLDPVSSLSSSLRGSPPPDQTHARSENRAKLWGTGDWLRRFGSAWAEHYQQIAYGHPGDSKACASLGDVLGVLPESERLAAQEKAPAMFAEFLGRMDPKTVERRHPFAFFVQEWGGLRVPKKPVALPGGKPWQEADKAAERQRASDRAQRRIAQENLDRLIAGEKATG